MIIHYDQDETIPYIWEKIGICYAGFLMRIEHARHCDETIFYPDLIPYSTAYDHKQYGCCLLLCLLREKETLKILSTDESMSYVFSKML